MALHAMLPITASAKDHAVILKGGHLDDALASPAASTPATPVMNSSAASWQPRLRGSAPQCECLGFLPGHALRFLLTSLYMFQCEQACKHILSSERTSFVCQCHQQSYEGL